MSVNAAPPPVPPPTSLLQPALPQVDLLAPIAPLPHTSIPQNTFCFLSLVLPVKIGCNWSLITSVLLIQLKTPASTPFPRKQAFMGNSDESYTSDTFMDHALDERHEGGNGITEDSSMISAYLPFEMQLLGQPGSSGG